MAIYGYIRVSTDKQTVENQRYEINRFTKRKGIKVGRWIEETVSGAADYDKRKLGALLGVLQKGDIVISSELSRLGRNLFMIMSIVQKLYRPNPYCSRRRGRSGSIGSLCRMHTTLKGEALRRKW